MVVAKYTLAGLLISISLLLACGENDRENEPSPTAEPVSAEAVQPTAVPTPTTDTPTPVPSPTFRPQNVIPPTVPAPTAEPVSAEAVQPTAVPTPTTNTPTPVPSPTFRPQNVILPTVPVPTAEPTIGSIFSKNLAAAAIRMSSVRGLSLPLGTLVDRVLLSPMEFRDVMSELWEKSRSAIEGDQLLYETLGLMDGEENLYDLIFTLNTEGLLGFFDIDEQTLYVVQDGEEVTPAIERTYVHEYVDKLQEANFDIKAIIDANEENIDAVRALEAVAEGSATVAAFFYINQYMTPDEREASQPELPEAVREALDAMPYAAIRVFVFPFVEGVDFAVNLYQEGEGWALVDEALEQPPASTEQILHSEKYVEGEMPIPVEMPDLEWILGRDWERIRTNRLGELFIRAWLETDFSPAEAATASTGWGGDAYSLFKGPNGQSIMVLTAVWDSIPDAEEFFNTVQRHTEARTGVMWEDSQIAEDAVAISLPDRTMYVERKDATTLIIVSPDDDYTESVRQAMAEPLNLD